jgi:nitroreductase
MEEVLEFIFKRRSVRRFTPQKVDEGTIVKLLQAAMAAPSATNARPWEFVVITEEGKLEQMETNLPFGRHGAPLMIIPLGNPALGLNKAAYRFWQQDLSAATENILIAASGMGLGGCWIGVYPIHWLVKRISEVLGLPEGVFPLCVINIGYPDMAKPARTQYDENRVHWQAYDPAKNNDRKPRFFDRARALLAVSWDYIKPWKKQPE